MPLVQIYQTICCSLEYNLPVHTVSGARCHTIWSIRLAHGCLILLRAADAPLQPRKLLAAPPSQHSDCDIRQQQPCGRLCHVKHLGGLQAHIRVIHLSCGHRLDVVANPLCKGVRFWDWHVYLGFGLPVRNGMLSRQKRVTLCCCMNLKR